MAAKRGARNRPTKTLDELRDRQGIVKNTTILGYFAGGVEKTGGLEEGSGFLPRFVGPALVLPLSALGLSPATVPFSNPPGQSFRRSTNPFSFALLDLKSRLNVRCLIHCVEIGQSQRGCARLCLATFRVRKIR